MLVFDSENGGAMCDMLYLQPYKQAGSSLDSAKIANFSTARQVNCGV